MKITKSKLREIIRETINELDENPCWDGYEAYGTKTKDGKEVPNCVPVSEIKRIRESETNLPKTPIPGQIKVRLNRAIDIINSAKLNYNQKLNLLYQFIDSLGLDKSLLTRMNARIRTNLESVSKLESNIVRKLKEGDTEYQAYFRKELEKTGKSSPADMTDDEKRDFFTNVDKGWDGKTESINEEEDDIKVGSKVVVNYPLLKTPIKGVVYRILKHPDGTPLYILKNDQGVWGSEYVSLLK